MTLSIIAFVVGILAGFLIGQRNPLFAAKTSQELEAAYEQAKRKLGLKP